MTNYTDEPYEIEEWTNRYDVIDGWVFRRAVVRVAGVRRLFSIPDHQLGAGL